MEKYNFTFLVEKFQKPILLLSIFLTFLYIFIFPYIMYPISYNSGQKLLFFGNSDMAIFYGVCNYIGNMLVYIIVLLIPFTIYFRCCTNKNNDIKFSNFVVFCIIQTIFIPDSNYTHFYYSCFKVHISDVSENVSFHYLFVLLNYLVTFISGIIVYNSYLLIVKIRML